MSTGIKTLRPDEEFVIAALAKTFSGSWRVAEKDPPDAYLTFHDGTAAVEISTLTQQVEQDDGSFVPRLSQDISAFGVCDQLEQQIGSQIPQDKRVRLCLESPLINPNKLRPQLAKVILEKAQSDNTSGSVEILILDNKITFQVIKTDEPLRKKIMAMVTNGKSSIDIQQTARFILDDRIIVKNKKCRSLRFGGPLWLALLNRYWLADPETYVLAVKDSTIPHRFDRIMIVSDDGSVSTIQQKAP